MKKDGEKPDSMKFFGFLKTPVFEDALDNWRAVFLTFQAWVVAAVIILLIPLIVIFVRPTPVTILPPIIVLPVMALILVLIRHKLLVLASLINLIVGSLVIAAAMWTGDGITDTNYAFFVVLIFAAGFLLGFRGAIFFALVGILFGVLIFFFPRTAPSGQPQVLLLIRYSTVFVIVAVTIGLAYRTLIQALFKSREEAERRKRSEENIRAIFNSSSDIAFIITNAGADRILDLSPSTKNIFGLERSGTLGKSLYVLWPARPEIRDFWTRIGSGNELDFKRTDGETVSTIYSCFPIPSDEDPSRQAVLHVFVNITERKKAEEDRKKFELKVQHSQKLESLGVLAGGIAHDFNNMLTAIIGNAELAIASLPAGSQQERNLTEIIHVSTHAAELCHQLLAYSGKGRFFVEPLDLNRIIREMEQMFQVSVSKKAVLRLELGAALPAIEADVSQIRQVVMNLVINASEALEESQGNIIIQTSRLDCHESQAVKTPGCQDLQAGSYVVLEVQDNGIGMDEHTRSRIFDPFYTTKFTGRGLGLAAVQGIVRGHKGSIKVYSEPGKGTSFKIYLPATGKSAADSAVTTVPALWKGSGLLLLADDDPAVRSVSKAMLEKLGFECIEAVDGEQAIELFSRNMDRIRAIVLDLTMPKKDGVETFNSIRKISPGVKVLLVSGYNEQEAIQKFSGKGLAGFLQKPYNISGLARALQSMLESL